VALRQSLIHSSGSKKKKATTHVSEHESAAAAAASASLEDVAQQLDAAGTARVSASVLRQLLINYLNAQVIYGEDEAALYARQYDLTTWLQQAVELETKKSEAEQNGAMAASAHQVSPAFQRDLEACQLNWDPPAPNSSGSATSDPRTLMISRDMALTMSRQLALDRSHSVLKWAPRVLDSLCARCNDATPAHRTAAVHAIGDMMRVDSTVLKVGRSRHERVCTFSALLTCLCQLCVCFRAASKCEEGAAVAPAGSFHHRARGCGGSDRHFHPAGAAEQGRLRS